MVVYIYSPASSPANISSSTPLKVRFSVLSIIVLNACILLKSAFFNRIAKFAISILSLKKL